eukprot:561784-Hanusia_phi.AAC.1
MRKKGRRGGAEQRRRKWIEGRERTGRGGEEVNGEYDGIDIVIPGFSWQDVKADHRISVPAPPQ